MPDDGSPLAALLSRLEVQWREHGASIANALADGVSPHEAQSAVEPLGITLPDEVLIWLSWHNGLRPDANLYWPASLVGPNGLALLSLEQAIDEYRSRLRQGTELAYIARPGEVMWAPEWFPLCSADASILAADTSVAPTAPTPLRMVDWEYGDWMEPVTDSLTSLVQLWVTALEERLWWFVPDLTGGAWDSDYDVMKRRFGRAALKGAV
jgi:cell wall assembly regulator SMI1